GVPGGLLLTRERYSVLGGVNGSWLLWVVGTQSVAVAASALVHPWPHPVASDGCSWHVERRADAVPGACDDDHAAVANGADDPGDPRAALLDSHGRHGHPRGGGRSDPEAPGFAPDREGDQRGCGRVVVRPVVVWHMVDSVAHRARALAPHPAPLAADIRAHVVERGLPPGHVQRGHIRVRQGGSSR